MADEIIVIPPAPITVSVTQAAPIVTNVIPPDVNSLSVISTTSVSNSTATIIVNPPDISSVTITGNVGPVGSQGPQGLTGATGPSGVVSAASPLIYNSGTQSISLDQTALNINATQVVGTAAVLGANTFTGKQTLPAATTAGAGLNIGQGTTPTSPVDGDVWIRTTGNLAWRSGGLTYQAAPLTSPTFSGTITTPFLTAGVIHNNSSGVLSSSLIVNSDISNSAAIDASKISGTALTQTTSFAGDVSGTSGAIAIGSGKITSTMILDGTILNADINSNAAIADTKLATISTANKVANSATTATSANIPSTIVLRDANSNFSIGTGTITGDLDGTATYAFYAYALTNPVLINNVPFDGSADITIGVDAGNIYGTNLASSIGVNQSQIRLSTTSTTGSYTLALTDAGKNIEINTTGANTLSVPTDATANFLIGTQITIIQINTGTTTISAVTPGTTTVNFYSPTNAASASLKGRWAAATLIKRAANTWILIGNLT